MEGGKEEIVTMEEVRELALVPGESKTRTAAKRTINPRAASAAVSVKSRRSEPAGASRIEDEVTGGGEGGGREQGCEEANDAVKQRWWHVNKGGFPIAEATWERMWEYVERTHPDARNVALSIRGQPCKEVSSTCTAGREEGKKGEEERRREERKEREERERREELYIGDKE